MDDKMVILQAHRGLHDSYPENSLQSCGAAMEVEISAIEIDVVINNEHEIIVSHDPFISSNLHVSREGKGLSQEQESENKIFWMTRNEINSFGYKESTFRNGQKLENNHKCSLSELALFLRNENIKSTSTIPTLNIELKSWILGYGDLFPFPEIYAEIVSQALNKLPKNFEFRIQSFDLNLLSHLAQYVDKNKLSFLSNDPISELKVIEDVIQFGIQNIGVNHQHLNPKIMDYFDHNSINCSSWTVNEISDLRKVLDFGIRNIITDNPIEFAKFLISEGFQIQEKIP